MARQRSTNRSESLKIWLKSNREKTPSEIGEELGVSSALIRKWKFLDKWDEIPVKRKRGAQPGNKNAVGNAGGPGGPLGNAKALKHGMFAKYLPEAVFEIVKEIEDSDPLDMLWNNIILLQAKLLHGQRITHVIDRDDITKEIKKTKQIDQDGFSMNEEEWNIQFAWDKFNASSKAEVALMREFRAAVRQFLATAPEHDERRLKLELMQSQVEKVRAETDLAKRNAGGEGERSTDDGFIEALKGKATEVWADDGKAEA